MENNKTKLSPPWVEYYRQIEAMFGEDPDIKIEYDESNYTINLYVHGQDKSDALNKILVPQKEFGNITVFVNIIPDNHDEKPIDRYKKAFEGNPVFSFATAVEGVFSNPVSYVVFRNKVVQYFADNLNDVNGNISTLYQDIANNIFVNNDGVCFCTDEERNMGKPLGEWP